eukprot:TRINITY_DN4365_c0_g1_i2.p1 TRINITY_DN4365_c0_g1~~TRINITY_DN4365_c0_g1_i2.p1  ORF type:complete len:316 (+),score=76.59 TRINITY_DN4365_c0_g1_i2:41-949(+)
MAMAHIRARRVTGYVFVLMAATGLRWAGLSFLGHRTLLRSSDAGSASLPQLRAEAVATADATGAETAEFLPGEGFVAMNRFRVREGTEAQFEKRWTAEKSSLSSLEGFRWFCLLRRVPGTPAGGALSVVYNYDDDMYEDDYSYVSFTMWDKRKAFETSAEESQGSNDDIATVLNGFKTPSGPPKSALWDGTGPTPEVFVAMNRFTVSPGSEKEFEQRWAARESKLQEASGFRLFHLMRRDETPDDDVNYISMSVWDDRASFDSWWNSKSFANMAQVQGSLLDREITRYFYEGMFLMEGERNA